MYIIFITKQFIYRLRIGDTPRRNACQTKPWLPSNIIPHSHKHILSKNRKVNQRTSLQESSVIRSACRGVRRVIYVSRRKSVIHI